MASKRFRDLERESKRLRRELLPDTFDPLGAYPQRVQIRTRAFLLLAHAAVESHLEEEAKRIARKSQNVWIEKRRITRPLAFLLASSMKPFGIPTSTGERTPERLIEKAVVQAFEKYFKSIKNNNGLKEQNVMTLFGPIGVESSMFGSMLLPGLESFGEARGTHAHLGAAVVNHLDPQTEHDRFFFLIRELEAFDIALREYEKKIR